MPTRDPRNSEQKETSDTTGVPDREAIIDALARERPWRRTPYLLVYFLRRWAVVLFTLSFMLATRQHWTVAGVAVAGAVWFDFKVTPQALDLRLSDREFVKKIVYLEVFEEEPTGREKKWLKWWLTLFLGIFIITALGRAFFDYSRIVMINKFTIEFTIWLTTLYPIIFFSRNNPLSRTPNIDLFYDNEIKYDSWKNHGYSPPSLFFISPLILSLAIILFCIIGGILGYIIFSNQQEPTVNDFIMFWYSTIMSAAGFLTTISMIINVKGQRIARYLLSRNDLLSRNVGVRFDSNG